MKYIWSIILFVFVSALESRADVALDSVCTAFMPVEFYQHGQIYETDAYRIALSMDYGQKEKVNNKRFWIVFSDQEDNVTYTSPSSRSKVFGHLKFNEQLRIAKIKKGFALVYVEPELTSIYPRISANAVPKGWIPMDNLLLWSSCPVGDDGAYTRGFLHGKHVFDLVPEFVMKQGKNGKLLLSHSTTLEGISDQLLIGWADDSDFFEFKHALFIEPNWNVNDVPLLKNQDVYIYRDKERTKQQAKFSYGRSDFLEARESSSSHFRVPGDCCRLLLLENDTEDTTIYKCALFFREIDSCNIDGFSENEVIDLNSYFSFCKRESPVEYSSKESPIEFSSDSLINFQYSGDPRYAGYGTKVIIGYTPKQNDKGISYWKPVLLFRDWELQDLKRHIDPVVQVEKKCSDDREAYVDAICTIDSVMRRNAFTRYGIEEKIIRPVRLERT